MSVEGRLGLVWEKNIQGKNDLLEGLLGREDGEEGILLSQFLGGKRGREKEAGKASWVS